MFTLSCTWNVQVEEDKKFIRAICLVNSPDHAVSGSWLSTHARVIKMSSGHGLKIRTGEWPARWAQRAAEIPESYIQLKALIAPSSNIYSEVPELSPFWNKAVFSIHRGGKRSCGMNVNSYPSIDADWQLQYLLFSPVTHFNERALCSSYRGELKIGLTQSPLSLAMWRADCKWAQWSAWMADLVPGWLGSDIHTLNVKQ